MFSKDNVKGIITGAVITSILSATVVFAAPVEKVKKVFFNNIKIYIDGNQIQPKDAQGNVVEPFIMDGTTYLPIRAVSNAFAKSVQWDGKTNSVYIGKAPDETSSAWLEEMDYFNRNIGETNKWRNWQISKDKDSTGASYDHGILGELYYDNEQYIEYLLNQKYKNFKGKIALHFDTRSTKEELKVQIYGDDKLIYTSPTITGGVLPVDFNVDVTGVIKLKIKFLGTSAGEETRFGIVNAGLYE